MAENKQKSNYTKLQIVGPADPNNGAEILRFEFEDKRKKPLDLMAGQILRVGEGKEFDISPKDAERLRLNNRWKIKEVTE